MSKVSQSVQIAISFIAALCLVTVSAQAQIKLPKVPKVLEDKSKKAEEARKDADGKIGDAKNDPLKAAGTSPGKSMTGKPALAYDKPYPPSILFQSLLDRLKVRENGDFLFDGHFKAVFLPDKEQATGKDVYYGTHPSQHSLTCTVKTAAGQTVQEMQLSGLPEEKGGVFWVLKPATVGFFKLKSDGSYVVEFAADGKPFFKFPFVVKKADGNDPYKPGNAFYSEGAWSDYGYLTFEGDEKLVRWNMWLFDSGLKEGEDWKNVKVEIVKGGKVVALNDEKLDRTRVVKRIWSPRKYVLTTAKRTGFSLKDLAATDGAGEFCVTLNGVLSVYPFTTKGGQVLPTGRAARESTDPLQFIESGGQGVFLVKKGVAN